MLFKLLKRVFKTCFKKTCKIIYRLRVANLIKKGEELGLKLGYQANQYNERDLSKDVTRRLNGNCRWYLARLG